MLLPRAAKVDCLLHCEAIEQAITASGRYRFRAASERRVRGGFRTLVLSPEHEACNSCGHFRFLTGEAMRRTTLA